MLRRRVMLRFCYEGLLLRAMCGDRPLIWVMRVPLWVLMWADAGGLPGSPATRHAVRISSLASRTSQVTFPRETRIRARISIINGADTEPFHEA